MFPLIETIKIEKGKAAALPYHQMRMAGAFADLFPESPVPVLEEVLQPDKGMLLFKCRVEYDREGIINVEYSPYSLRPVNSFLVVDDDDIDYRYKSSDRSSLERLFKMRGEADDVLICRRGLITDTSYANVAFYDGSRWLTPRLPLLCGTRRKRLLEKGLVKEADIGKEDLASFEKVRTMNAMIEFGQIEFPATNIICK